MKRKLAAAYAAGMVTMFVWVIRDLASRDNSW
jgi:hypothetical protein